MTRGRVQYLTGFALALLVSGGCDVVSGQSVTAAEATFDRTLAVTGAVDLNVRTGAGSIRVTTGPGNSVHVIGRVRSSYFTTGESASARVNRIAKQPPIAQSGNAIRIGETPNDDTYRNVQISYEITVPAETRLESTSGSGGQSIGSVRGPVLVHTGSGSITIGQVADDVDAMAGSGSITVERVGANFVGKTGSGGIDVKAVGGTVRAQTGSGHIQVGQTGHANVAVQTGSGSVTLDLPDEQGYNLDAKTGSGSIRTSQPITMQGGISRHHVQGTVRGGGVSVDVMTGSGSIQIR